LSSSDCVDASSLYGPGIKQVTHTQETCTRNLHQIKHCSMNGATFLYQKLSNTADQWNRTILVTCIGASFWYKFLERVLTV